ncbi:MAG: universal stress protein [Rhodoferax sp.]
MFNHILLPIDGSDLSDQALEKALERIKGGDIRLTVLYVKPNSESSIYGETALLRSMDPALLERVVEGHAKSVLDRVAGRAQAAGVAVELATVVADEPYEGIIAAAAAHDCDLILMASHGYRGIKGMVLGSQTHKVLVNSRLPVLVYR